jgi:hypothetical protein
MTWMQVENYLLEDDRCVLPLGSTEQHAYLSLAVDAILSERVAADAAEPLGVPVFPAVAYGLTPYFMAYPGTVTLTPDTYARLLREVLGSIVHHGFRRILVVNGHGGNREGCPAALAWASEQAGVTLRWHDWWAGRGWPGLKCRWATRLPSIWKTERACRRPICVRVLAMGASAAFMNVRTTILRKCGASPLRRHANRSWRIGRWTSTSRIAPSW